jgi:hypothetical protein
MNVSWFDYRAKFNLLSLTDTWKTMFIKKIPVYFWCIWIRMWFRKEGLETVCKE